MQLEREQGCPRTKPPCRAKPGSTWYSHKQTRQPQARLSAHCPAGGRAEEEQNDTEKDENNSMPASPQRGIFGVCFFTFSCCSQDWETGTLQDPSFGRDGHLPVVPTWTFLWSMGPSAPKAKNMARFSYHAAPRPNIRNKTSLLVPFNERCSPVYNSYDLAALTDYLEVD